MPLIARRFVRAAVAAVCALLTYSLEPSVAEANGSGPPGHNAAWVSFTDQDANQGLLGGAIRIGRATDESDITHYVIRWGLLGHCSAADSFIAELPKTGSDLTYQLPFGTAIPGAVYEILVYTKNQNGERPSCQDVWTPINDLVAPSPDRLARQITATFTVGATPLVSPHVIEGVEVRRADDETNLTHYALYWGDIAGHKLNLDSAVPFAVLPKTGQNHVFRFPDGTEVPPGAIYVLACSRNYNREYCGPSFDIPHRTLYPINELDVNQILDTLDTVVANIESITTCPGLDIVLSCGNLVCDSGENASSCPADCSSYVLASYNYQTLCRDIDAVFTPTSVGEIQNIVMNAASLGQHVKVSGAAHSASDIMCTDGVLIHMSAMNHILGLETFEGVETVNVEGGVKMLTLGEWLDSQGRSVGFTHLGFNGTTVAGTLGTSSHGSSPEHNAILSQRVVSLDVVGADGVLRTYTRGTTPTDTWRALTTHLGLLGVVVRARIAVEPQFNLHVKVTYHDEEELYDGTWGPNFIDVVKGCDYGQLNWFPGLGKFMRTCGRKTTEAREPGARNYLLNPSIPDALAGPTRLMMQAGACDPANGITEFTELFRYMQTYMAPPFVKDVGGGLRNTMDVIGPSNYMMSSPLIASQEGFTQLDWEIAVPESRMNEAMGYIRGFVDGANQQLRVIELPLVGMFLRFAKIEDQTLMAYENAGGPYVEGQYVIHVEMPIYMPIGFSPQQMATYLAPFEEYVTALITDFDGRGHWGKNRDWIFPLEVGLGRFDYDQRLARFRAVVTTLDPNGVFRNTFSDELGIVYPGP